MAEYIEREALMRRIKEIHCAECDSYHGVRCRACWVDDALGYIDSGPTADVAPVVRCKDCEHLINATVNGNGFLICDISDMETAPDDFCSHGDRREEAGP